MGYLVNFLFVFVVITFSKTVTIPNNKPLVDTSGKPLLTGELSILFYNNYYYLYMNDWGNCTDDNCNEDCVYGLNHVINLYATKDFEVWENKGTVLGLKDRQNGTMFRPQVVYNQQTKLFLMWYENRYPCSGRSCTHYAIATSTAPEGPFTTTIEAANFSCTHGGDFSLFVDTDEKAYIILTASGFCIEQLDNTYTKGTNLTTTISPPSGAEGPNLFKRGSVYYALYGKDCCACTGGSNVWVSHATNALGPYTLQSDIGTDTNGSYTTRAQQSAILPVRDVNNTLQYVWMGNQWGTAPDKVYNHDLIYWYPLQFNTDNTIQHIQWKDEIVLTLPD